ncbi:PLP-dependent aminotransferase family protein [Neobacillus sp. PS3-40]|uniref:MocR-like pyridoxine biosynthesis transcription factor PdxR n=1 Tax=Neobacillus sp. PS3-40 TaxID=3070679 RepID=UPI0027E0F4B3|nr:PLP-dependent aminotransferase family protein [Neobacillus sp. PS3-40]WML42726.1 PLP-dependent aminotransferase family protein [Neobacillus sp. PS3-40]
MIVIDKQQTTPFYLQIYNQLKKEITTNIINKGDFLQGSRALAHSLKVSRNTVDRAYQQLAVEGYIEPIQGVGFKVNGEICELAKNLKPTIFETPKNDSEVENRVLVDFTYTDTSYDLFPKKLWRKLTNEILEGNGGNFIDSKGEISLREELTNYLKRLRGVNCNPNQIVITNGLVYSLEIIAALIRDKKMTIAFENPSFSISRSIFEQNGYEIIPSPLTMDGISLENIKNKKISAVVITPSHQFPTGIVTPISKRLELLKWASEKNVDIIEDDYDSEFRYNSAPIPSIQAIDTTDCVIYLGTFSKPFSANVRMSYIVLPEILLHRYHERFKYHTSRVSILQQQIMQKFIESGEYERNIRKLNTVYQKKHNLFIKTVEDVFFDKVTIIGKNAGLFFLLEVDLPYSSGKLVSLAREFGVGVYDTDEFWMENTNPGKINNTVFVSYTSLSDEDIVKGIHLLYKAWFNN